MVNYLMGKVAPHLVRQMNAISLASRFVPVGSVNIEALSRERGVVARRKREAALRALELGKAWDCVKTDLDHYRRFTNEGGTSPNYTPCIAQFVESTDTLRMISILGVEPEVKNTFNGPRIMTATSEGDMLLVAKTMVFWLTDMLFEADSQPAGS